MRRTAALACISTVGMMSLTAVLAQGDPKINLKGRWELVDQRTGESIATIRLTPVDPPPKDRPGLVTGEYVSETRWPRAFNEGRGPSGNRFRFEDRELKIIYIQAGRNRVDELMVAKYSDAMDKDQFLFRITGGLQIARDAVGMTLLFRRL